MKIQMGITKKTSASNLTQAFAKRNIPILVINPQVPYIFQAGLGCNQKRFRGSEFNDSPGYIFSGYKRKVNKFLAEQGQSVARSLFLKSPEKLPAALKKIGFPLVIKPANTASGGKGVTTNIKNEGQAREAFAYAMNCMPGIKGVMVEEMLAGDDYRVLVFTNEVIGVLKRTPAKITGDGKRTIQEIIEDENEKRQDKENIYLKKIKVDSLTEKVLELQGLKLDDKTEKGQEIILRKNANISTGGETENFTEKINPKIVEVCKEAARLTGLVIAGIDIITTDISKPLCETGGKIIEVNNHPGLDGHIKPSKGDGIDVAGIISKYYFDKTEDAWIPIELKKILITDPKTLSKYLSVKPCKVIQSYNQKEIVIESPDKRLGTYLLDPLTTSVKI